MTSSNTIIMVLSKLTADSATILYQNTPESELGETSCYVIGVGRYCGRGLGLQYFRRVNLRLYRHIEHWKDVVTSVIADEFV